ncbi:MAG: pyridoxal-phosphate-dependent aminotransferase family protein [Candidatus Kariarchaeaceae archaeon]|jgi:alanine-glyoxylate transaminase/serine-glyoxylate transaminase/serine-pyruvate transaminase
MRTYTPQEPLLMIPGPVESDDSILQATASRAYSHTEPAFVSAFQKALLNMRTVFGVSDSYSPLVVAGGGTLAMEIAMLNLIDTSKDQKVLICESGYFGDRFVTLANSLGLNHSKLSAAQGMGIGEEQLRDKLSSSQVDFAFIQHVDTSTGVANDIEMFARVCSEMGVVSVVDGVCALGGQELYQEKWGVDIYLTGAQKALALPPGLAVLMYSQKAREISESRQKKIPSYYADTDNWWPIMDAYIGGGVKYFSTPATNLIVGLAQATQRLVDEGMENVYSRHRKLSTMFRGRMEELGFGFITDTKYRANTLSTPTYLDNSKGGEFRKAMLEQGVLIAGGIQKGLADTYFRVGHMGNVTENEINYTLNAIESVI